MNVRCPECKTLFRVADEKVGPHGVRFRCGKCKHVFLATREDAVPLASAGRPAAAETPPPAPNPTAAAEDQARAEPIPPWLSGTAPARPPKSAAGVFDISSIDLDEGGDRVVPRPPPRAATPPSPEGEGRPPGGAGPAAGEARPAGPLDFDDRTVFEDRPSWLGGAAEGLDQVMTANPPGESWARSAQALDPFSGKRPPPRPVESPTASEAPPANDVGAGTLRAEELFGAESPSEPARRPAPPIPRPPAAAPRVETPPASRAAPASAGLGPRAVASIFRPTPLRREIKGWGAVLRSSLIVVGLAMVLAVFVLWRNGWRFEPLAQMVAQAFSSGRAVVRSRVPGLEVRQLRRVNYRNSEGVLMLTVSGELRNTASFAVRAASVLVRFLDETGTPVAEREHLAVGLFEPLVLSGFRNAADVDQEYRKRQERSAVPAEGKLDFMIVFFPMPPEMEGKRLRMLLEVTGAQARGA